MQLLKIADAQRWNKKTYNNAISATRRVMGLDKDMTKTGADRRIELCARAVAIVERQLRLRRRLMRTGVPEHEQLFVTDTGEPIRRLRYPYARWQRTLRRLAIAIANRMRPATPR